MSSMGGSGGHASSALPVITAEALRTHSRPGDHWMAIHGKVYDLTRFAEFHPGGKRLIEDFSGKDASDAFDRHHAHVPIDEAVGGCVVGLFQDASVPRPASDNKPSAPAPPHPTAQVAPADDDDPGGLAEDNLALRAVYETLVESNEGRPVTRRVLFDFLQTVDPRGADLVMSRLVPPWKSGDATDNETIVRVNEFIRVVNGSSSFS